MQVDNTFIIIIGIVNIITDEIHPTEASSIISVGSGNTTDK